MKFTIELREDWIKDVAKATEPELGSNDDEHDLLIEVSEQISQAMGFDFIGYQEAYNLCPACEKPRPNGLGNGTFEPGSECPSCGHIEPPDDAP